jgi:hypothetical protein
MQNLKRDGGGGWKTNRGLHNRLAAYMKLPKVAGKKRERERERRSF